MSIGTINDVSGLSSSNQRRLARTSDGTLYLAYVTTNASGGTRVYVRSSSDGGQNWSAATMVSGDCTSSACAVVSDSRDDLHVVYVGLESPALFALPPPAAPYPPPLSPTPSSVWPFPIPYPLFPSPYPLLYSPQEPSRACMPTPISSTR